MILIVDDDASVRSSLTFLLKRAGLDPMAVPGPKEAIAEVRRGTPRLILMDMNYTLTTSGDEGICLLKQVKLLMPEVPVILMTAWGSIQLAVEGMKAGAFDFITKPWNNILLLNTIQTALELRGGAKSGELASEKNGSAPVRNNPAFSKIVGCSGAITEILETVERVAKTNASVLITGESGTGKELIAEAIHMASLRSGQPFVKVNLGGISQSLFESEMFGHRKGAFTDAYADRTGRFSLADHGTIFLDEIGDLDLSCQVKLLRVLQDQTFEVLGESRPRKVDVRVVSATNRDLHSMVQDKSFREDLFYRINLIPIYLPPLRERKEDIAPLAKFFAKDADIPDDAVNWLRTLPFRGNVRELKNLVERTVIVSGKKTLGVDDFKAQYSAQSAASDEADDSTTLEGIERKRVLEVLDREKGNVSRAAKELGISRASLYRRMEKYGLDINQNKK